jgi:putative ABC transport system permease protein
MLKNYFKIAYRNIIKNKVYSLINITGLAIGIAASILIFLFVSYELSFDDFHKDADNIYRIVRVNKYAEGIEYDGSITYPFAEALRIDYPELENVTQVCFFEESEITIDKKFYTAEHIMFVDSIFFKMFEIDFNEGDAETALINPNSAVISESLANTLFGTKDPVGEFIKFNGELDLQITGIIKNQPHNTHLHSEMLVSMKSLSAELVGIDYDNWQTTLSMFNTFVMLPKGYSKAGLEENFKSFFPKFIEAEDVKRQNYYLQPITEIHNSEYYSSFNYTTDMESIFIFSVIGLLIILIAGINFINLTTAQSIKRSKEVGIRKVFGAFRKQLVYQMLGETSAFTIAAIIIGLIIAQEALPYLNQFLGNDIQLSLFSDLSIVPFLIIIIVGVNLLTGIYPSLVISRFSPIESIRNKITSKNKSGFKFRNGLVIVQFIISQILIISTIVISSQMEYFYSKDLGFNSNEIVSVTIPDNETSRLAAFKNEIIQNSNVINMSYGLGTPTTTANFQTRLRPAAGDEYDEVLVSLKVVDEDYLETFDIKLLSGRYFDPLVEGDTVYNFVANETLLAKIGIGSPEEAIGKQIRVSRYTGPIIGVVKDFHMSTLAETIEPMVMINQQTRFIFSGSIKYRKEAVASVLSTLETAWGKVFPEASFDYQYYDEYLDGLYEEEENFLTIIRVFAAIAIFIGCLGILGLMSFIAVQKTREIGLRKVLGASVTNIFSVVTKEFTRNIVIANLIAWPISWYLMSEWLQNFSYRINLNLWMFLTAGIISIVIVGIVISYQSLKAANANPVDSLRN